MKRILTVAILSAAVFGLSAPVQAAEAPTVGGSLPSFSISGAAGVGA